MIGIGLSWKSFW